MQLPRRQAVLRFTTAAQADQMHVACWQSGPSQNLQVGPLSESDIGQLLGYIDAQQPAAQAVAVVHSSIFHRSASSEDTGYDRFHSNSCVELLVCVFC